MRIYVALALIGLSLTAACGETQAPTAHKKAAADKDVKVTPVSDEKIATMGPAPEAQRITPAGAASGSGSGSGAAPQVAALAPLPKKSAAELTADLGKGEEGIKQGALNAATTLAGCNLPKGTYVTIVGQSANDANALDVETVDVCHPEKRANISGSIPASAIDYGGSLSLADVDGQLETMKAAYDANPPTDPEVVAKAKGTASPVIPVETGSDDASVSNDADAECTVRLAEITAARDFIPLPLTNCAAPQPLTTQAQRDDLAKKAREMGLQIMNRQNALYAAAQARIAQLAGDWQNSLKGLAWAQSSYRLRHQGFKEYFWGQLDNISKETAVLQQIRPMNADGGRSAANYRLMKDVCVLPRAVFERGGAAGNKFYGVVLQSIRAPSVEVKVYLDDHPAMDMSDWGGQFKTEGMSNSNEDVTRLPFRDFIPVRADGVGPKIGTLEFQPLSSKGTPFGAACTIRIGLR